MLPATVKQIVSKGLDYIAGQQLASGGFASFSSPSLKTFQPDITYETTFIPAIILGALASNDSSAAKLIRQKLAHFVRAQASKQGSFNYWSRDSAEYHQRPYPDDLDDTFCALSSLYAHDSTLVTEAMLAKAVKLLLATESQIGGPYRTWLVSKEAGQDWQDVDVAVNANIGYFLSQVSNPLPNLTAFIDQALLSSQPKSPYYPSEIVPLYYIARAYSGSQRHLLIRRLAQSAKNCQNALDLSLILSSQLRLGQPIQESHLAQLLSWQSSDGSWPAAAFCVDPGRANKIHYNGAASLTTALVIECLSLYQNAPTNPANRHHTKNNPQSILDYAYKKLRNLEPEVRLHTITKLTELATSSNGPEITGLAQRFNHSLTIPLKNRQALLKQLSTSNLYGWLAYTIYDDFLDDEGKPALLPVANICQRQSLQLFQYANALLPDMQKVISDTFDAIDNANAWELSHCRFLVANNTIDIQALPDYSTLTKLAERSLGHCLAPLSILAAGGFGPSSHAYKNTQKALTHYLIVRQLNDDVHDWQKDLEQGHISYVVARLLKDTGQQPGKHSFDSLIPELRQQFWHQTLPDLCSEMQQHAERCREALTKANCFKPNNIILDLLAKLEAAIAEAQTSQLQALAFLKHYEK